MVAESYHLHVVAVLSSTRALRMVRLTLVIHISKCAGCVVHRAEVVEERAVIQGLHHVARAHVAIIICAGRRACNDIERSLPKGLVESVLDLDFIKHGPDLSLSTSLRILVLNEFFFVVTQR